jgi:putative nucleotidyltransferase with HDIG domain
MTGSLSELITATSELAALPSTTVQLLELLDDLTVDARAVLDVIEKDPSLTANLLKLSNSAYYGLRRRVGSVREALVMLGNRTVLTLAFATSMGEVLRGPLRAYHLEKHQLWHHSLATAVTASNLLEAVDREARARAFTAGLVHDIGKLMLDRPLAEQLQQLPCSGGRDDLLAAERSILGFDHATAGGALAEAWNFPAELSAAIAGHHTPQPATAIPALVRAVAAANHIALMSGFGGGYAAEPEDLLLDRLGELGVEADAARGFAERLPQELQNLLSILGEVP